MLLTSRRRSLLQRRQSDRADGERDRSHHLFQSDRAWVGRAIVLLNGVISNWASLPSGLDDDPTRLKPKGRVWSNLLIDTHSTHDEIDGILTESSTG